MADLENKTVNTISIQDIMHKYQCYSNKNHPLNYNLFDHCFIHSHRHVRWQRFYKKKFELDRRDHDSHANCAERYLV